jgi:hypothetical protein
MTFARIMIKTAFGTVILTRALFMYSGVIWTATACSPETGRRFGRTFRIYRQVRRVNQLVTASVANDAWITHRPPPHKIFLWITSDCLRAARHCYRGDHTIIIIIIIINSVALVCERTIPTAAI